MGGFGRQKRPAPPEYDGDNWDMLSESQRSKFKQRLHLQPPSGYTEDGWDKLTKYQRAAIVKQFKLRDSSSQAEYTLEKIGNKSEDQEADLHRISTDISRNGDVRGRPRSSSDPVDDRRKDLLHRRTSSLQPASMSEVDGTAETLRSTILSFIKQELERRSIRSSYIHGKSLNQFLPRPTDQAVYIEVFQRLLSTPITVSDEDIGQIFRLHRASKQDPRYAGSLCYYHCWQMDRQVLEIVIGMIEAGNWVFKQLAIWQAQIRKTVQTDKVFIRYVGQTSDQSPYDRRQKDLKRVSGNTLQEVFRRYYEAHVTQAERQEQTFALVDTNTSWLLNKSKKPFSECGTVQERSDILECAMIALFGSSSLLNTKPGGISMRYLPCETDLLLLSHAKTSVIHQIQHLPKTSMTSKKIADLKFLTEDICKSIVNSSGLTPEVKQLSSLNSRTHFLTQATCSLVHNYSVLSIIGNIVPERSIRHNEGFFDGKSQTSHLIIEFLQELARCESSFGNSDISCFLDLVTFNNAHHWPYEKLRSRDEAALGHLRTYFAIVQPLITVTLGEDATSYCLNRNVSPFFDMVGKASMEKVGTELTIVLPHVHPGWDHRTDQSHLQRHLYFLCWIATWVLVDSALTIVNLHAYKERKWICSEILSRAQQRLGQLKYHSLLASAKEQLLQHRKNQKGFQAKRKIASVPCAADENLDQDHSDAELT